MKIAILALLCLAATVAAQESYGQRPGRVQQSQGFPLLDDAPDADGSSQSGIVYADQSGSGEVAQPQPQRQMKGGRKVKAGRGQSASYGQAAVSQSQGQSAVQAANAAIEAAVARGANRNNFGVQTNAKYTIATTKNDQSPRVWAALDILKGDQRARFSRLLSGSGGGRISASAQSSAGGQSYSGRRPQPVKVQKQQIVAAVDQDQDDSDDGSQAVGSGQVQQQNTYGMQQSMNTGRVSGMKASSQSGSYSAQKGSSRQVVKQQPAAPVVMTVVSQGDDDSNQDTGYQPVAPVAGPVDGSRTQTMSQNYGSQKGSGSAAYSAQRMDGSGSIRSGASSSSVYGGQGDMSDQQPVQRTVDDDDTSEDQSNYQVQQEVAPVAPIAPRPQPKPARVMVQTSRGQVGGQAGMAYSQQSMRDSGSIQSGAQSSSSYGRVQAGRGQASRGQAGRDQVSGGMAAVQASADGSELTDEQRAAGMSKYNAITQSMASGARQVGAQVQTTAQYSIATNPNVQSPVVWQALDILRGRAQLSMDEILQLLLSMGNAAGAGTRYATMSQLPQTSFACTSVMQAGFYADTELECQVFRRCDINGNLWSYVCPDQTLFNQITLVCDYFWNVDCSKAQQFYDYSNPRLYTTFNLLDD